MLVPRATQPSSKNTQNFLAYSRGLVDPNKLPGGWQGMRVVHISRCQTHVLNRIHPPHTLHSPVFISIAAAPNMPVLTPPTLAYPDPFGTCTVQPLSEGPAIHSVVPGICQRGDNHTQRAAMQVAWPLAPSLRTNLGVVGILIVGYAPHMCSAPCASPTRGTLRRTPCRHWLRCTLHWPRRRCATT